MAKPMSMTLPDRVHAALVSAAKEFEMEAPDFLKSFLFNAAQSKDGATLKLVLPPPVENPNELKLPLDIQPPAKL